MGKNELLDADLLEVLPLGQKRKRWRVFKAGSWKYGDAKVVQFKRACEVLITERLNYITDDGKPAWQIDGVFLETARPRPNVLRRVIARVGGWFRRPPKATVPKVEVVSDTKAGT